MAVGRAAAGACRSAVAPSSDRGSVGADGSVASLTAALSSSSAKVRRIERPAATSTFWSLCRPLAPSTTSSDLRPSLSSAFASAAAFAAAAAFSALDSALATVDFSFLISVCRAYSCACRWVVEVCCGLRVGLLKLQLMAITPTLPQPTTCSPLISFWSWSYSPRKKS